MRSMEQPMRLHVGTVLLAAFLVSIGLVWIGSEIAGAIWRLLT